MKAIGSFIVVLILLCVCFIKCTSDQTKIQVYQVIDTCIENQIEKCNQRILEADTISKTEAEI